MIKKILKLDPDFQFLLFLCVHIVVWTLIPTIVKPILSTACDITEMFVWGKEFQWGYHKHPPFAAWLSGIWFYIFPTNNFFYFFFAQINVAIGFVFSYLLSKEFLNKHKALISVLALSLLIQNKGMRYNNDAILLSLWPCCAFFMFKAFKYDKKIHWALAGLTSAIAMLSKYYSALLLVAMVAIFIFNNRKDFINRLLKPGPIICLAIFFIVMIPHFYWLLENDFMSLSYLENSNKNANKISAIASFILTNVLVLTPIILLGKFLFKINYKEMLIPDISTKDKVFLSGMVYIPFLLTILLGSTYYIKARFGMPLWFLFGAFIVSKSREFSGNSIRIVTIIVYSFLALCLLFSPVMKILDMIDKKEKQCFPAQEISKILTQEWRDAYKTNLKYITGDVFSVYNISFYSPDHPSVLIDFNYKISTWIKGVDQIKENGIAVVCYDYRDHKYNQTHEDCMKEAENSFNWTQIQWKKITLGLYNFDYALISPSVVPL